MGSKSKDKPFIRVKPEHLIDPVIPTAQQKNYTCGPAVVQAILAKYGKDVEQEELLPLMATSEKGTSVDGVRKGLEYHGLHTEHANVSIELLATHVRSGDSVIVCVHAYGFTHWVALIGESRRNWFFADPSAENGLGFIPKSEFMRRWEGRYGIIVWGVRKRNSHTVPIQRIPI